MPLYPYVNICPSNQRKGGGKNIDWGAKKNIEKPKTNLQSIFSRKTLVAVQAWKRFHRQMDPFMSLQIMIAVETLRALIASERSFAMCRLSRRPVHVLQAGAVSTVER